MSQNDNGDKEDLDDYQIQQIVSKAEERHLMMDPQFEGTCARFWQLMTQEGLNAPAKDKFRVLKAAPPKKDSITFEEYCALMKRIYRVLAPLYREKEVQNEVTQEWITDAAGCKEMSLGLFQKTLFRIAHQWGTHVDVDEYCSLLTKVYDRITHRRVVRGKTGFSEDVLPSIVVQITQTSQDDEEEGDGWDSCATEDDEEGFMYEDREGRRYKKKEPSSDDEADEVYFTTRDPFTYNESVRYFHNTDSKSTNVISEPSEEDFQYEVLTDLDNTFPFGYPTEQYMCFIKNEVHKAFQRLKEEKKQALADMKRELFEGGKQGAPATAGAAPAGDADPGLLIEQKNVVEQLFVMHSSLDIKIKTFALIQDSHYNSLRLMFKDSSVLSIRPEVLMPKVYKKRAGEEAPKSDLASPLSRKSMMGYNPALERRINYKMTPIVDKRGKEQRMFINVNYLIVDPVFETAYRCDVKRIETSGKLANKPGEDFAREEEFCNVTTSLSMAKQIMMQKKFEALFTQKLQGDEDHAVTRDNAILKSEMARVQQVRQNDTLQTKQVEETHETQDFLKMVQGPFFKLLSTQGPINDDPYTMRTNDLCMRVASESLKILLLGLPRSGKTTLAKQLEQKLNVLRISPEVWIEKLFAKVRDLEENPPEAPEVGDPEEGAPIPEPPKLFTDLEQQVLDCLRSGNAPDNALVDCMIKDLIASPAAQTRGFVLDITFTADENDAFADDKSGDKGSDDENSSSTWANRILKSDMLQGKQFSHIVELQVPSEEVIQRAQNMLASLDDGVAYSAWERFERNKPKEKKGDDEEDQADEEEDENAPKKLIDLEMIRRPCDADEVVKAQCMRYKDTERKDFDQFIIKMSNNSYIDIETAGLNPEELALCVTARIKPNDSDPLNPVATIIEGGGDFKGLLTEGIEPEDGTLPRQWSMCKTIDLVALKNNGAVAFGVPDQACHYANNVFVFSNEDNLKEFVANPKKFLCNAPYKMPADYRLMLTGPRGSGFHTQAKKLSELYGWRIVDFPEIIKAKMQEIIEMEEKLPNNIIANHEGPCMIGMSDNELNEIKEGKMLPTWKFLPWILEFLGVPLMQKPPPPPGTVEEKPYEEMSEEEKKEFDKEKKKKQEEEKKKKKEEEEKLKAKEERAKNRAAAKEEGKDLAELGLEESEEEIIIPDLPIDQLVPKVDEDGNIPKIGNFIFLGFPHSEIQATKLKEYGLGFDRILFLNDLSEEDPGKELKPRFHAKHGADCSWDWEKESESAAKIVAVLKEHISEEIVKDINCAGSSDEVFIRIRTELDPFFLLVDVPEDNRVSEADVEVNDEEYDATKWLPKGNFGHYCPVTYVKQGWLVKGSKELESTINGKTFWFSGEAEQAEFKFNPTAFLKNLTLPLAPPAPKIMIIGMKGAGVSTQINKLCTKYKIDQCPMMKSMLDELKIEKEKRQRGRLLNRGFRPLEQPEEPDADPVVDPEINDDPEDFDRAAHERDIYRRVLPSDKALVYDGNWTSLPEDAVSVPLQELIFESRRAPEIVIVLRCKEESTFERCIDDKAIEDKFEELMKKRNEDMLKRRAEDKIAKEAELREENKQDPADPDALSDAKVERIVQSGMKEWTETRIQDDEAADEDDPDKPVLQNMKEEDREKLRELREKDDAFLGEFVEALKEKHIDVVDSIQTEISADYVFIKILDQLKKRLNFRTDLIERELCSKLTLAEVPHYEKSYSYKPSKFGVSSPLTPFSPVKTKQFACLYRERIYYLASEEERTKFMLEPSKFTLGQEPTPCDLTLRPTCCVIGVPRSGKTCLAETLAKSTGMVHLKFNEIIEWFVDRDCVFSKTLAEQVRGKGKQLDDLVMIDLLSRRCAMKDCAQNGWVLDGFPQTREQAVLMVKKGLNPGNMFQLLLPIEQSYKRSAEQADGVFGCNRTILARRLQHQYKNQPQVAYFFQKYYNSLIAIDGQKSRWFIETVALEAIEKTMGARLRFSKDFFFKLRKHGFERPCVMEGMNCDRVLLKKSLSQFGYICPVTWRQGKQFINCCHRPELTVFYQNVFFYFAGVKERQTFVDNPSVFTQKVLFSTERNVPIIMRQHKCAEVVAQEKGLSGHCPVTLKDETRIEKGCNTIVVNFKDTKFVFVSQEKAQKFYQNPSRYANVKLPTKMPPKEDPVALFDLQKQKNSIIFMEQALGQVVTRGLREVGENRLKYPTLSVKETMLKLFAIFLKAENPANTDYMKQKYKKKMQEFIFRCEMSVELYDLMKDRERNQKVWPEFKEEYYNKLGAKYDTIQKEVIKEKHTGFASYLK